MFMLFLLLAGPHLIALAVSVPASARALHEPSELYPAPAAPRPSSRNGTLSNHTAIFHSLLDNGFFDVVPAHRYRKITPQNRGGTHHRHRSAPHVRHADVLVADDILLQETPVGALKYGEHRLVPDHEWLQVMRFGSKCGAEAEGYSIGFPTDCGSGYAKINRSDLVSCNKSDLAKAKIGYGCWFYFAQPDLQTIGYGQDITVKRSSGVSVNVGRSLRVDSRASASATLGLPCADPPLCDKKHSVQDKLYCERARDLGYDSIQFARPHLPCLEPRCLGRGPGWVSELVLCTGQCMAEEVTNACPPGVELRTAEGKPCECSDESHALNCGKGSMLYGRPDDGTQQCPLNLSSPELGELFVNNLADGLMIYEARRTQQLAIRDTLIKEHKPFAKWFRHAQEALRDSKDFDKKEAAFYSLRALEKALATSHVRMPNRTKEDLHWLSQHLYDDAAKAGRKKIGSSEAAAFEATEALFGKSVDPVESAGQREWIWTSDRDHSTS